MDLIVQKNGRVVAIECKASTAPQIAQGFWNAVDIIRPDKTFVVAPVERKYEIHENVDVVNLGDLLLSLYDIFE